MTEVTPPASEGHRALKTPAISFEFFPPKTEEMERSLWDTIKRLAPLAPNFVSVTYGAGGSTRERTHSTITRILAETELLPAALLTCVGAARGEIDEIVGRYHDAGATRAITQVFFDNDLYFRYLDRVRARGIDIPIVPGIMPMHNFKQARNFVTRAGTTVPDWLAAKFEGL